MEELFDKDDALGRLVREEGLLKTSYSFTSRVMSQVNISAQKPEPYKPLLSRRSWILIILGFLSLAGISLFAMSTGQSSGMLLSDRLKPALDFMNGIHFSFNISSDTLMIATIVMACMGLLLLLDYFLNIMFRLQPKN